MYQLERLKTFTKCLKKLSANEQSAVERKLVVLAKDPFYHSLRTQKYRSRKGVYESSVNMDIRVLWTFEDGRIILLRDVGHHDIL